MIKKRNSRNIKQTKYQHVNADEKRVPSKPHCYFSRIYNQKTKKTYYRKEISLKQGERISSGDWEKAQLIFGEFLLPIRFKQKSRQIISIGSISQQYTYIIQLEEQFNFCRLSDILQIAKEGNDCIPQDILMAFFIFIHQYIESSLPLYYLQLENLFISRHENFYGQIYIFSEEMCGKINKSNDQQPLRTSLKRLFLFNQIKESNQQKLKNQQKLRNSYDQALKTLIDSITNPELTINEIYQKIKDYIFRDSTRSLTLQQEILTIAGNRNKLSQQLHQNLIQQEQVLSSSNLQSSINKKKKIFLFLIILLICLLIVYAIYEFTYLNGS